MHTLELNNIQKEFKGKMAVKQFTAEISSGIYGLLGENGAGKTTLMRLMCDVMKPTEGHILCDGMMISKMGGNYRRLLGYLPQDFGYYPNFSCLRFLQYMSALKALPEEYAESRIQELLDLTGLSEVKHNKLKTFSGGMLKRVGIAQALLNDPDILILDEPTSGLDPRERVRFRNIISSLSKNRMIILSTHIVSDVEFIADKIMMMKQGKLLKTGTIKEMEEAVEGFVWECLVDVKEADSLNERYIISNLKNQGDKVSLRIISELKPHEEAVSINGNLEDVYLYYLSLKERIC